MKTVSLRGAIRLAIYGVALSGVAATPYVAAQEKTAAASLDVITVLGSRIKRTEAETALPVLTINREELERTGLTQVGDILKELAINGPSLSLNTNNGNTSGIVRVNLRGCGAQRTLVLVNGKRWISDVGLGGSVDLSSIPFAAVDRVEILKEGASALYGTDAICGVINITTRTNWSGEQFKAYYGQYDQDDGMRKAYDFTVGKAEERWSVLFNASYTTQDAVSAANRDIAAVPLFGFPANTSTPGRASYNDTIWPLHRRRRSLYARSDQNRLQAGPGVHGQTGFQTLRLQHRRLQFRTDEFSQPAAGHPWRIRGGHVQVLRQSAPAREWFSDQA